MKNPTVNTKTRFEMVFTTEKEAEAAYDAISQVVHEEDKKSLILFSDMVDQATKEVIYRVRMGDWSNPVE